MSSETMNGSAAERLSALVDGELDRAATEAACAHWKGDSQARCSWHAYQLIGDVLRSEDLAAGAERNEAFLHSLRARLEAEPVVLAPAPLQAPAFAALRAATPARRGGSRWMLPSAIAAAFLLVIGTFTVLRPGPTSPGAAPGVAVADATLPPVGASSLQPASLESVEPTALVMDGKLVRDSRLDRYLAAHTQFAGSSALGLPSTFLRSATVESDAR